SGLIHVIPHTGDAEDQYGKCLPPSHALDEFCDFRKYSTLICCLCLIQLAGDIKNQSQHKQRNAYNEYNDNPAAPLSEFFAEFRFFVQLHGDITSFHNTCYDQSS